ncbi:DDE-domain-containing protein [Choiromyces venosus 120613-1]|uniref:DDE-domain-containing protein n=1 Tax=Choiromyces venosus 120613-1 TaxID=1336337 RepID=A0A3N4IYC7_9PEZI|nr:DDE-domain-containing protein [Choiromyces venosus 120613-1]
MEIYYPYSWKNVLWHGRPEDKRLLILDGHSSHVNLRFSEFCDSHNIICFCLPAHSTHILQPLDVGLFGPLQKYYGKVVENYHISTNIGINYRNFLPLYKQARSQAYSVANIKSAFHKTGIVPFLPHMFLPQQLQSSRSVPSTSSQDSFPLEKTPYTKCQLRQQTNRALDFIKTATAGEICNLILRFSHTVEYGLTTTDIATTEMQRLRVEIKIAKDIKKDRRILSRARVITRAEALQAMQEANAKKQKQWPKQTSTMNATTPQRWREANTIPRTLSTIHVTPFTPRVCFDLSKPRSIPHSLQQQRIRQNALAFGEPAWISSSLDEESSTTNSGNISPLVTSTGHGDAPLPSPSSEPIAEQLHRMHLRTCNK